MVPAIARASDTAGLNNPPDTRKKIQTFTKRENPKAVAMNNKVAVSVKPAEFTLGRLAMLVAPKAMKRNMVVPTYSPTYSTKLFSEILNIKFAEYHGYKFLFDSSYLSSQVLVKFGSNRLVWDHPSEEQK